MKIGGQGGAILFWSVKKPAFMDAGELPGAEEIPLATLAIDLDERRAVRGEFFERVDAGLDMTMRNL